MQIVDTADESKTIQTLTNTISCSTCFVFSNKSAGAGGGCFHRVCRKSVHVLWWSDATAVLPAFG